jgi:hypothetical protein
MVKTDKSDKITAVSYIMPLCVQNVLVTACYLVSMYSRQTTRWSLRGVNILSAVRGEYRACRWTEDFLLVSAK